MVSQHRVGPAGFGRISHRPVAVTTSTLALGPSRLE